MKKISIYFLLLIIVFSSCKSLEETQREVELFQPKLDSTSKISYKQLTIKPLDQIKIQVLTEATVLQEQAAIFNLPGNGSMLALGGNAGAMSQGSTNGVGLGSFYEVDKDGFIYYPKLGNFKVAGLTSSQLRDTLATLLSVYVKDIKVVVNIVSVPIYGFGQIATPGKIIFNEEKVTLLDFLAKAGGNLQASGGRLDNIVVVREDSGLHKYYQVDVRNPTSLYNSPAYQLQQNDLVYVHPTKTKLRQIRNGDVTSAASNVTFFTGLATSFISIALILISLKNL